MQRLIRSGDGWRVGWYSQGEKYRGLIGADDWAIELTQSELNDFIRLLSQLVDTMSQMQNELMDCEKISCEAETGLVWMEVEGYPDRYSLRIILNCDRGCEGNWRDGVVPELLAGIRSLNIE